VFKVTGGNDKQGFPMKNVPLPIPRPALPTFPLPSFSLSLYVLSEADSRVSFIRPVCVSSSPKATPATVLAAPANANANPSADVSSAPIFLSSPSSLSSREMKIYLVSRTRLTPNVSDQRGRARSASFSD